MPRGWRAFGCIAWRSNLPSPKRGQLVNQDTAREILETPPSAPLSRVAEIACDEPWGDWNNLPGAVYETPDGRAVILDTRLEPMLRGLRPMLIDSAPYNADCIVAGVDKRGVTRVLVMPRLP